MGIEIKSRQIVRLVLPILAVAAVACSAPPSQVKPGNIPPRSFLADAVYAAPAPAEIVLQALSSGKSTLKVNMLATNEDAYIPAPIGNDRIGIFDTCKTRDAAAGFAISSDLNQCVLRSDLKIIGASLISGEITRLPRRSTQIGIRNDTASVMQYAGLTTELVRVSQNKLYNPDKTLNQELIDAVRREKMRPLIVFQPFNEDFPDIKAGKYENMLNRLDKILEVFPDGDIQIWNEPDFSENWPLATWPQTYAEFADKVYERIKASGTHDHVKIVMAAISDQPKSNLRNYASYYQALKTQGFDKKDVIFAVHAYYEPRHIRENVEAVEVQLKNNGLSPKLWLTEFGTDIDPKDHLILPLLDETEVLINEGKIERAYFHELPTEKLKFGLLSESGVPYPPYLIFYWWMQKNAK